MTRPITIQVATDTTKVAAGFAPLESALQDIMNDAEEVEESLEGISDVKVDIDIRQQAIDQARRDIERLKDEIAENVLLGLDTKQAETRLRTLSGSVRKLTDAKQTVQVDIDTTGAEEALSGMEGIRSGVAETALSLGDLDGGLQSITSTALSTQFVLADLSEVLAEVNERNAAAGRSTSRFGNALTAVAGFAAGPWGIAITAGVALLGAFSSKLFETSEATKALTEQIDWQAGAFDERNRKLVADKLEEEGALELAKKYGVSTKDLVTALLAGTDAQELFNKAIRDAPVGDSQAIGDIMNLMDAYDDAAEAAGKDVDKNKRLADAIGATGDAAADTASQMAGASSTMEESVSLWEEYNKSIGDARSNLDGLVDSLDIFNGRIGSTKDALADYSETQRDLNKALKDGATSMDVTTEAGAKNDKMIRDQAQNIAELAEARMKDAGESGESTDKILKDYADQRAALIVMADKLGLSGVEAKKYVDQLLKTPDDIKSNCRFDRR